jgi:SAM-dependent methyltransferase
MAEQSFGALEQAGWVSKAGAYDEWTATITNRAIDPILDTFGGLAGKRLLDLACGTGNLAAAAAGRGATADGIDFASTMVEAARKHHPGVSFRHGDAEQLPYGDASFDAVACGFGLLHMARPDVVLRETARVLRTGGRFTFTVWCGPDQGADFFALVLDAIRAHGTLDVPLPPAPPMFRFAAPEECRAALAAAGFVTPKMSILPLAWRAERREDVLDFIYRGTVRMAMVLEAQAASARAAIHRAIVEGCEAFREGDAIDFRFPAAMTSATRS